MRISDINFASNFKLFIRDLLDLWAEPEIVPGPVLLIQASIAEKTFLAQRFLAKVLLI